MGSQSERKLGAMAVAVNAATKIQAVFRGWSLREANEERKELYWVTLCHLHQAPWEKGWSAPVCMRFMVAELGWDGVENDLLYRLLTELDATRFWDEYWAPIMDDDERVFLFKDDDSIEEAMDSIRLYIKRFNAASKIQAVFRGAMLRARLAPPESGEGLNLDDNGFDEGHPHWGQWMPSINLWIQQCECQKFTRWWDASKRVWRIDTSEAMYERFVGK